MGHLNGKGMEWSCDKKGKTWLEKVVRGEERASGGLGRSEQFLTC